jgi:hypothetical protein
MPGVKRDVDTHRLQPRGSSQGGLRQYNERVVLQAIRLHGALPAAEIARLTQLTAQTVSLITKRLLDDGLLVKGEPVRGKVGQPSVPLSLDPDGAYSVGIKVGRRSMDVLLIDFTGAVRERSSLDYRFPDPDELLAEIGKRLAALRRKLGNERRELVQGVGIAAPMAIGGWQQLLGFSAELAARWQAGGPARRGAGRQRLAGAADEGHRGRLRGRTGGRPRAQREELPLHLRRHLHRRRPGAGQPVARGRHRQRRRPGLAAAVAEPRRHRIGAGAAAVGGLAAEPGAGLGRGRAGHRGRRTGPGTGAAWQAHTERWLDTAGSAIAQAVNGAACLLDMDGVILDGSCSRDLLAALQQAVERALPRYSWEGVARPALLAGTIGSDARALGGALLPLYANFAPDRELFLKVAN